MEAIADPFNNDFNMDDQIEENPMNKQMVAKELIKISKLLASTEVQADDEKKMKDIAKKIADKAKQIHDVAMDVTKPGHMEKYKQYTKEMEKLKTEMDKF